MRGWVPWEDQADIHLTGHIYESLKLWEEYVTRSLSWSELFGDCIRHVKYESLLEDPINILADLSSFLNITVRGDLLFDVVEGVKPDRKYAFLRNPELVKIYEMIQDRKIIKQLGYKNI